MRRSVGFGLALLLAASLTVALAAGVIYGTRVPSQTEVRVYLTPPATRAQPTDDPLRHRVLVAQATQLEPTSTPTPYPPLPAAPAPTPVRTCPAARGSCVWPLPTVAPTSSALPVCETPEPGTECVVGPAPTGAALPAGLR